jgi:hypothetical protein
MTTGNTAMYAGRLSGAGGSSGFTSSKIQHGCRISNRLFALDSGRQQSNSETSAGPHAGYARCTRAFIREGVSIADILVSVDFFRRTP